MHKGAKGWNNFQKWWDSGTEEKTKSGKDTRIGSKYIMVGAELTANGRVLKT